MKLIKKLDHAEYPLYEPLETLLVKLYHKQPNLSFESCSAGFAQGNRVINQVRVFNCNEFVGTIEVSYEEFRRQGKRDVYKVFSPRIQNRISPRNFKITKLPEEALKVAAKVLGVASSDAEVADSIKQRASGEVSGVSYNATRNAERLGEDHLIPLMNLAMMISSGGLPTIGASIASMVAKPNIEKSLRTAEIANSVYKDYKSGSGVVVREERDGSLLSVALHVNGIDSAVKRYRDTYDMPELYQTKLAMLRILEHKQPVESIGVKFLIEETNWYYMTGGEIITTS